MNRTLTAALGLLLLSASPSLPQGYPPEVAASKMVTADGLAVTLYASEPNIHQPILVTFDDRGRLWTIQYLQYPNPAGLTRVRVDRFSRTVYDRVPEPPPRGPRGADRITICEDTDGDGRADRFRDFVDGLNLCTGLTFGHGGVYVLQVPYLLFYPDRNRDDVPDSDPIVLLDGFGMEDAQSLVNHLTWGPDGWLYGVTGSTSTNVVRGVEFQQAVWRYDPVDARFELFCEGGGNLFGLTFDAEGHLFFSSNGNDLAFHGVQGAYYRKNFGKHGPLHNPFAYGFFEHLPYDAQVAGPRPGGTIYLGDALPSRFRGALLCCDFLQHSASWWRLEPLGSTFQARHGGTLLDARDRWFCAPDLGVGPDGAVYICDFHDERTAHPDPDANWDRSNGRIYRIAPPGTPMTRGLDLGRLSAAELVELLRHANGWHVNRAIVHLADRRDPTVWPRLLDMVRRHDDPQLALRGLWGLHAAGGFDDTIAADLLNHPADPVRWWTVRLLGDRGAALPSDLASRLLERADHDSSVAVRLQLAATARRLPGEQGLPIVESLIERGLDRDDPFIPLMLWWAIEARAMSHTDRLLAFFGDRAAWDDPGRREQAIRLVRRYAAEGTRSGYLACEALLRTAPASFRAEGLAALDRGLAERSVALGGMGTSGLFDAVAQPEQEHAETGRRPFEPLTEELVAFITAAWESAPTDPLRARLALRAGVPEVFETILAAVAQPSLSADQRAALLRVLAELGDAKAVPLALELLDDVNSADLRQAALEIVARHGGDTVTKGLLDRERTATEPFRAALQGVLLSRPAWARAFLDRVDQGAIPASDVPVERLRVVALHEDPVLDALVRKHWGAIQAGTPEEKLAEMRRLSNDLRAGRGDRERGEALFRQHCATCHTLHGTGGTVGPDLTGIARDDTTALLTSLVDPSAVIRAPYLPYLVSLTDGRVLTGILAEQDGATLTLVDAKAERVAVPRVDVEDLRELPTSIMPEGLLKTLGPQEVRDLFGYLQENPVP